MTQDEVLYIKAANYGDPEFPGVDGAGNTLFGHYGGYAMCPRCRRVLAVGQEQLEHGRSPCSIGHMGTCRAHFTTTDPETQVPPADAPEELRRYMDIAETAIVYRRPIVWHSDV